MPSNLRTAALAASAAFLFVSPTTAIEPCAQVAAAFANNPPTAPNGAPIIDIDTAYACLKSVPVAKSADLLQLEGYKTLVNFQSTLAYLKDPTPGWLYPGVDVVSSLDGMISKLQKGAYDSEYDVQFELWSLINSGYDFHLTFSSDILNVFYWGRTADLVSLSSDPNSLPSVYDTTDVIVLSGLNSSSYQPSPVVSINNTDVEQWLNQYAAMEPWDHDPDANYNNIFYSAAVGGYSQSPAGKKFSTQFYHFPGTVTILKFANGTEKTVQSYATVSQDFTGVTDGESFFQKFCTGPAASASASAVPSASGTLVPSSGIFSISPSSTIAPNPSGSQVVASSSSLISTNNFYTPVAAPSPKPAVLFFPEAFIGSEDGSIAGFFPEEVPDLSVITLPTFGPRDSFTFQNIFRSMLATAKSLGKTKLIIDVRGNNGGTVVDGFSLFKELFPSMTAWGGSNMAAWPLFNAIGEFIASLSGKDLEVAIQELGTLSEFYYGEDLSSPTQEFSSWSDFYGPVKAHGGMFTNIRHYNFSSPNNALGPPAYGYANDSVPQPQTFTSDNIVILSDGACGSTCAIFSELMKTQGGVQFITVGGRKQYGPTQPVGGSKGSNDQALKDLVSIALGAAQNAAGPQLAAFKQYSSLPQEAQQFLNRLTSNGANVNYQNNIRKGDDSVTPLQFAYEASNCRFFYTPEMFVDQSQVWAYTYNLQWGNGTCLKDSTGDPSAATGFLSSYFGSAPPAGAKNFFGADITWSYPGAYSPGEHHSSSPSSSASASSAPSSTSSPSPPPAATGGAASINTSFNFGQAGGVLGTIIATVVFACASVFLI